MLSPLIASALLSSRECNCDGFCSEQCGFGPTTTQARNLTLYRLTPPNVTDLADKNTGDLEGDLFFALFSVQRPLLCRQKDPPPYAGCFLDLPDNIIIRFVVEIRSNGAQF